jgi:hypothetical protein
MRFEELWNSLSAFFCPWRALQVRERGFYLLPCHWGLNSEGTGDIPHVGRNHAASPLLYVRCVNHFAAIG